MKHAFTLSTVAAAVLAATAAFAQQQVVKPAISNYAVDVNTQNMSIPGMPSGGMGGMMMRGMGMGGGPTKELWLGLRSSQKAAAPAADHDIPPGMSMGPALPLLAPPPATPGTRSESVRDEEHVPEKPKARMLVYWGCGDTIRPGQPKVADTEKMSMAQFGEALKGRNPPERGNAHRNAQLRWPNEREPKTVPPSASLIGNQFVHGTATPDIRFAFGEKQDFLAPVELAVAGGGAAPMAVSWKAVPHAQGYFLQAMGHRQSTGEMIIWSSSEVQDTGWGLLTWLPNDFLRRMISEKVVLTPDVTNCRIPAGVFDKAEGGMLQAIAYGEELNLVHPPRPADPKVPWDQIWTVRVRVKSTGMVPLGMADADENRGSRRGGASQGGRDYTATPRSSTRSSGGTATGQAGGNNSAPPPEPRQPAPADTATDAINTLRGIFKF